MTDKTEAQIEREKQAIAAMSNAKATMATVLERTSTLEHRLRSTKMTLQELANHVGPLSVIPSSSSSQPQTVKQYIASAIAGIDAVLA